METSDSMHQTQVDITILGGGIAGLWLLNRLRYEGYHAILLEAHKLGSAQTIASQGMIHGGIKYALSGALTGASQAIAEMPQHWRNCLAGHGDVDLRQAKILSEFFYLWSSDSLGSKMKTFFASKATRGRVHSVEKANYPAVFQHPLFSGNIYQLQDIVLDVPSVVKALADNYQPWIYKFDWSASRFTHRSDGSIENLIAVQGEQQIQIQSKAFIFSAGEGNEAILKQLNITQPQMQRRPLKQVMVKHQNKYWLYAHCMGSDADASPRLTISSHAWDENSIVWYLGGQLATDNLNSTDEQLIVKAQQELNLLFPWMDFCKAEWRVYSIDRAEPKQRALLRPEKAFVSLCQGQQNLFTAWPTKLTLAPNLANETLALLRQQNILPGNILPRDAAKKLTLPQPDIAATVWSEAFNR